MIQLEKLETTTRLGAIRLEKLETTIRFGTAAQIRKQHIDLVWMKMNVYYRSKLKTKSILCKIKKYLPTTFGSRSTYTARGTCLPARVSLKNVL